jgi:predicted porin
MKKAILVAASLCAYGPVAHAQTSVVLYGVIDEGIMFNNNVAASTPGTGGRKFYLDSLNGIYGSRWGLKGTEDLGDGMHAVFMVESGINLNNGALGQGGLEFGRQAFIGIGSSRYGDVTLGRQYDSVVLYV